MKPKTMILMFVIALAVLGAIFYGVNRQSSGNASHNKATYYCPMHPTYTSDRPGDCPICNMKLVPMKNDPASVGHQHARESGEAVAPKEMTLEELMKLKPGEVCLLHKCKMGNCMMKVNEEMFRSGKCPHCGEALGVIIKEMAPKGYSSLRLREDQQAMAGIKTSEVIKKKMAKTIRALGRVAYDPELYQAEQELVQSREAYAKALGSGVSEIQEQAEKLLESTKLKLKLMGLSEELISEVQKTGKPDRSLLYAEPGQKVWLYMPIYEYEIPLVKIGQMITAELPASPDKKFEGTIRSIDPVLDPLTRTNRVRAQVDNADGLLKPEMYVNASIAVDLGEVIAVPEEAVFMTGEKNIVFVAKVNGDFDPRQISIGAKSDNFYEVKSGLGEGELVVTNGNFLIDSESRLKAALQGMGSSSAHQHGG